MPSSEGNCPANLKHIIRELEPVLPPLPRSGSVQQVAGANRRWRCQFRYRGSRRESAVAQLTSEVIRQRFFQDFFAGFLKGLLPNSTRSNKATSGLPLLRKAAW